MTTTPHTSDTDSVDLCPGCNTMKHLGEGGVCGRCRKEQQLATPIWLDDILDYLINNVAMIKGRITRGGLKPDVGAGHNQRLKNDAKQAIRRHIARTEKAYGGCRNCYGKGYATVNDRWHGYGTDGDIGGAEGYVTGGNPNAMKVCACDRGAQLRQHIAQEVADSVAAAEQSLDHKWSKELERRIALEREAAQHHYVTKTLDMGDWKKTVVYCEHCGRKNAGRE